MLLKESVTATFLESATCTQVQLCKNEIGKEKLPVLGNKNQDYLRSQSQQALFFLEFLRNDFSLVQTSMFPAAATLSGASPPSILSQCAPREKKRSKKKDALRSASSRCVLKRLAYIPQKCHISSIVVCQIHRKLSGSQPNQPPTTGATPRTGGRGGARRGAGASFRQQSRVFAILPPSLRYLVLNPAEDAGAAAAAASEELILGRIVNRVLFSFQGCFFSPLFAFVSLFLLL